MAIGKGEEEYVLWETGMEECLFWVREMHCITNSHSRDEKHACMSQSGYSASEAHLVQSNMNNDILKQ